MNIRITLYNENNWFYNIDENDIRIPKNNVGLLRYIVNKMNKANRIEDTVMKQILEELQYDDRAYIQMVNEIITRKRERRSIKKDLKKQLELLSRA